jgi:hypothetical protein
MGGRAKRKATGALIRKVFLFYLYLFILFIYLLSEKNIVFTLISALESPASKEVGRSGSRALRK